MLAELENPFDGPQIQKQSKGRKTKYNSVYFTKGIDLENSLNKPDLKYASAIRYIYHFMIMNRIMHHYHNKYDGWVGIHSKHLEFVIGKNYRRAVELGRDLDIWQIDDSYQNPKTANKIVDGETKKYKLNEWAYESKWERQIVCGRVEKYLRGKIKDKNDNHRPLDKIHHHLKKFLYKLIISDIPKEIWDEVVQYQQININMIKLQDIRCIVDKNGRLHTNLTNMDSRLRPYITYQGLPLVGVDIRNSQPLFAGWMLGNIAQTEKSIYIASQEGETIPYVPSFDSLTSLKPLKIGGQIDEDWLLWLETCQKGVFYEKIMANNPHLTRNQIKKQILTGLYGDWNNGRYVHKMVTALYKVFPQSMDRFAHIKKDDYAILANIMQKRESNFIIKEVCLHLMNEYPDMPLFTIHDSILTTPQYYDILLTITKQHFTQYNVYPTINKQQWTEGYEDEQIQFSV